MRAKIGRLEVVWLGSYFGDIWHRRVGYRIWPFHAFAIPGLYVWRAGPLLFSWWRL